MKKFWVIFVGTSCVFAFLLAGIGDGRGLSLSKQPAQKTAASTARLTIEVTGGEKDIPVENASVYLKYVEERKITKDKQFELNVKTNRDGVAHVPDAPLGRVLIQIIADGWKTYGRWYDISDAKDPIKIHLDRPPKWY
jgi:hypothetical protein